MKLLFFTFTAISSFSRSCCNFRKLRRLATTFVAFLYAVLLLFGDGLRIKLGHSRSGPYRIQQAIFEYAFNGIMEFTMGGRTFKKLHSQLEKFLFDRNRDDSGTNRNYSISPLKLRQLSFRVKALEKRLYPWSKQYSSLLELKRSYSGRGIVIPLGHGHVPFALTLLKNLRLLNCTLPVMAYYQNERDITAEERDILSKEGGIPVINLSQLIDDANVQLEHFAGKPFAVLASPFREVILIEADVIVLQNPEAFFDHPVYLEKRALYFYDLSKQFYPDRHPFLRSIFPRPLSDQLKKSRTYGKYGHDQEAGLYVFDKVDRFYSLLAACKLNCLVPRAQIYWESVGDKETPWLGSEMMQEPYGFEPSRAGVIGEKDVRNGTELLCGRLMHLGSNGQPAWFNGGIIFKYYDWSKLIQFQYWGLEGDWLEALQCIKTPEMVRLDAGKEELLAILNQYWLTVLKYRARRTNFYT